MRRLCVSLFMLFAFSVSLYAQDDRSLEETLNLLSGDAAQAYLDPVASGFGANINAGWFHKSPAPKKLGFDLEISLVAMGSQFADDKKSFSKSGQFTFNESEANQLVNNVNGLSAQQRQWLIGELTSNPSTVRFSGATIIGAEDDYITVAFPGNTYTEPQSGQQISVPAEEIILPVGGFQELADIGVLPMFAPQLSIGTVYGSQATFRYLPDVELQEGMGTFSYFGFGIQHNPTVWLPMSLPVDVSAAFYTQNMQVGDLMETSAVAFGLNASKQFGFDFLNVTPYAGFMLESATTTVKYNFIVETPTGPSVQSVNFDLEGENTSRLILGLSLRFLLININADYNIGAYNNFSAGLSFAI